MHLYTTGRIDWIAASDRADLLRILRDGGYDEPEEEAREAKQLAPDATLSVQTDLPHFGTLPEGATSKKVRAWVLRWSRTKVTATASAWAAWAAEQGDDYGARCVGLTEH